MNNPRVTVLMPVYNGAQYLKDAIDSVLAQTFTEFEFLIVNDGSTDNSLQIIESYKDKRIKVLSQENQGVSAALNLGLKAAVGDFIARTDCDDICKPDRLEKQINFLINNPDFILVGSDADYVDKDGVFAFHYQNIGHTNEEIQERIHHHCPFIHSAVIYNKEAVISIGGYDENAYLFEDYFLWIKLVKAGKVANITEPLMIIRFNPSSVTIDDKDCSKEYLEIKQKALLSGILTDEEGLLMKMSFKKIDSKKKIFSYHSLLAKKYLWDNPQASKARMHLFNAIKINPQKLYLYALLVLTLMPTSFVKFIYKSIKK
jgi:glycosyltransferase involved in cell wall biosynthesis